MKELTYQVKQGNEACKGYWPERFPIVELPEALKKMDLAVEVLRWLMRTGAGVEVGGNDRGAASTGGEKEPGMGKSGEAGDPGAGSETVRRGGSMKENSEGEDDLNTTDYA